jgi:hypothetical protein
MVLTMLTQTQGNPVGSPTELHPLYMAPASFNHASRQDPGHSLQLKLIEHILNNMNVLMHVCVDAAFFVIMHAYQETSRAFAMACSSLTPIFS